MSITSLARDSGPNVSIVRITSTDNNAACAASGYITAQAANILAINSGPFTWQLNDFILLAASDGDGLYTINSTFTTLAAYAIPAVGVALSPINTPDPQSDVIWVEVVPTEAQLASTGKVNVIVSSGTKQYVVRSLKVNYSAAGLSGNSGDRLLSLTDGTTVYNSTGITAALLGTPINTSFGGTGNPVAGAVAQNKPTAAGANLYLQYIGGTADYNAGSVSLSVEVQRVA